MNRLTAAAVLGLACWCGAADAQDPEEADKERGTVHINAIKNPERWTYRAIAAGLDMFDA